MVVSLGLLHCLAHHTANSINNHDQSYISSNKIKYFNKEQLKKKKQKKTEGILCIYPFVNNVSIKHPIHVAEPKSFKWTMWVLLRITKLMVVPVCAHPINWIPLKIPIIIKLKPNQSNNKIYYTPSVSFCYLCLVFYTFINY